MRIYGLTNNPVKLHNRDVTCKLKASITPLYIKIASADPDAFDLKIPADLEESLLRCSIGDKTL